MKREPPQDGQILAPIQEVISPGIVDQFHRLSLTSPQLQPSAQQQSPALQQQSSMPSLQQQPVFQLPALQQPSLQQQPYVPSLQSSVLQQQPSMPSLQQYSSPQQQATGFPSIPQQSKQTVHAVAKWSLDGSLIVSMPVRTMQGQFKAGSVQFHQVPTVEPPEGPLPLDDPKKMAAKLTDRDLLTRLLQGMLNGQGGSSNNREWLISLLSAESTSTDVLLSLLCRSADPNAAIQCAMQQGQWTMALLLAWSLPGPNTLDWREVAVEWLKQEQNDPVMTCLLHFWMSQNAKVSVPSIARIEREEVGHLLAAIIAHPHAGANEMLRLLAEHWESRDPALAAVW